MIAPDYVSHGLREIGADRWTRLDRGIVRELADPNGVVDLRPDQGGGTNPLRDMRLGRMRKLEGLGLAEPEGPAQWRLTPGLEAGLCGLGDLVLTCSSPQSRNMSVGLALGAGETLDAALAGKRSVAEGVASAPAVAALASRHGVDMPICAAVAALLAGETSVDAAVADLLARPLKPEH